MNISIKTIPHKSQRYETCGDWWWTKNGDLEVRVSDLGDYRMEYLIASHEVREALLCKYRNIKEEDVTKFDLKFEEDRNRGKYTLDQEPGMDPDAPYKKEHFYATSIEMIDALEFGVDWGEYNNKVMSLSQ